MVNQVKDEPAMHCKDYRLTTALVVPAVYAIRSPVVGWADAYR